MATFRLAQLVSRDDGPLDVFVALRTWARKQAGYWQGIANTISLERPEQCLARYLFPPFKSLAKFLDCPYCVGVWMAAGCFALVVHPTLLGDVFLGVFALAGAQAFLEGMTSK